jgi:hypothetical protein
MGFDADMGRAARVDTRGRYGSVADTSTLPQAVIVESGGSSERAWLFSRRADFWLATGGASFALLAAVLVISWHGDRELDAIDLVLSELHLGATYDAIVRRRLWRRLPGDVLLAPLAIIALTYVLSMSGQTVLLTSIAMYAAVWHRGRQSLGVARFYQCGMGGPVSATHDLLFRGAIYLPMAAGLLAYSHLAPLEYEREPYVALDFGAPLCVIAASAAVLWVTAYVVWVLWRNHVGRPLTAPNDSRTVIHNGESWVVLANAVAFGSGYYLGASNASFLLVLAVHHELQYLYFTYAMARRQVGFAAANKAENARTTSASSPVASGANRRLQAELRFAACFLVFPLLGFIGAVGGGSLELEWLGTLGIGGLFCHYWLDGRIWARRALRP